MFDPARILAAAERVGMLATASYQPRFGARCSFAVDLKQPDELAFDGQVQGVDTVIEYQTVHAPDLAAQCEVLIAGTPAADGRYLVRAAPRRVGDGLLSHAWLQRLA